MCIRDSPSKGVANLGHAGGLQHLMDDHAVGAGDHAPTVTVGLHVKLQPPEGLGADAGDALQQRAAAA
eukprot:11517026-Alexandrium_andersonii.AAC.1